MAYNRTPAEENAWVFLVKPTMAQIISLLEDVPAWHSPDSKPMSEYASYVIPFSRSKDGPWRLYTTVAGKIKILYDAHIKADGTVVPIDEEMETPEYRGSDPVMVILKGRMISPLFGSVWEYGTGVMGNGAGGADRTNPIENAQTSWRGRAASAICGAGILPYTGIASAEEVQTAAHREDMADAGFRVVSAPAPTQAKENKSTIAMIEKRHVDIIKRMAGVKDNQLDSLLPEYAKETEQDYPGSAIDFLLEQPVTAVSDLTAWLKEKAQGG